MPQLEAREIQRELKDGWVWPVYWLFGAERMKSRELLKRIQAAVSPVSGFSAFAFEKMDADTATESTIVEAANTIPMGGGVRIVVVENAHRLSDAEALAPLLGPKVKIVDAPFVAVFVAQDLDKRKKITKLLVEKAAIVPCLEIPDPERPAWVGYLAKQRALTLNDEILNHLAQLDPWSLDIVDQELEKLSLSNNDSEVFLDANSLAGKQGTAFIEAVFSRNKKRSFELLDLVLERPDDAFALIGLLAWHVRQIAAPVRQISPWKKHWPPSELLRFQAALCEVDFGLKQTPKLALGLWHEFIEKTLGVRPTDS